jgi:ankyrin repeat protein
LQAASRGGYTDIVRLLLEKGADVNARGGQYGSALEVASWLANSGQCESNAGVEITQILLENGAYAEDTTSDSDVGSDSDIGSDRATAGSSISDSEL